MTDHCDWNPALDRAAERVAVPTFGGRMVLMDEQRGCKNDAEFIVGAIDADYRLCASCACLPRFARCSKRALDGRKLVNEG